MNNKAMAKTEKGHENGVGVIYAFNVYNWFKFKDDFKQSQKPKSFSRRREKQDKFNQTKLFINTFVTISITLFKKNILSWPNQKYEFIVQSWTLLVGTFDT